MRILGIDPGYAIVGYGVVDYFQARFTTLAYGAITTTPSVPFEQRLLKIYEGTKEILICHRPDAVAIEKLFFYNNKTTGIDVAQARGVILLACAQCGVPTYEYTPMQVKQAVVGYGKAQKIQVMEMTKRLLRLSSVPKPDDTADALAIAVCHAHSASSRLLEQVMRTKGGITVDLQRKRNTGIR